MNDDQRPTVRVNGRERPMTDAEWANLLGQDDDDWLRICADDLPAEAMSAALYEENAA